MEGDGRAPRRLIRKNPSQLMKYCEGFLIAASFHGGVSVADYALKRKTHRECTLCITLSVRECKITKQHTL
jgi:hypothetical protein